jgi:hypothetical protein
VAGVVFWQSLKTSPGDKVPLPLEVGFEWLGLVAKSVGVTGDLATVALEIGSLLVFAALAAVFMRCCRVR